MKTKIETKFPSLQGKVKGVDEIQSEWRKFQIESLLFRGLKTDEVILFHRPSKTLLISRAGTNITDDFVSIKRPDVPFHVSMAAKRGEINRFVIPRSLWYHGFDPKMVLDSVEEVCSLPFEQVAVTQGKPLSQTMDRNLKLEWRNSWKEFSTEP